jgi:FkbM family methyltransferase
MAEPVTWTRLIGSEPSVGQPAPAAGPAQGSEKLFSQLGEDCLLAIFFDFKNHGFFIDVGAFDGVYLSNTFAFERLGWSGLCIEAMPEYFDLCVKNRPGSTCVHAACLSVDAGQVELRAERGGLFSGVAADENFTASIYRGQHVPFDGFRTIRVPSASLNGLLAGSTAQIDFVSIDVEGAELEVLSGFDLERYRPRVLVIEANKPEERQALDLHLGPRGYRLARSLAWNHFYVRSADDMEKLRAIAFAAKLERPAHPLGRLYNRVGDAVAPVVRWPAVER